VNVTAQLRVQMVSRDGSKIHTLFLTPAGDM